MPDHVHILIGIDPAIAISELVRDIKAGSSNFINGQKWVRGRFNWQEGFGAFSYSRSQIKAVGDYILEQESRHEARTFKKEYVGLLTKFDVEFDERYLFDFIE
jgi:REP element-mobilizing transposase RayT